MWEPAAGARSPESQREERAAEAGLRRARGRRGGNEMAGEDTAEERRNERKARSTKGKEAGATDQTEFTGK